MNVTIEGRTWVLGESIGSGGFGRVYHATSEGEVAAVKLVPKDPGAQRELLLAGDLSAVPNIVPVLGLGEYGHSWAMLMPLAEKSLRDLIEALDRKPLDQDFTLPILLDVAASLVSLTDTGVVHRDLKPENLLLLSGKWCLTDFGISRYAEATTAIDTHKYSMTKQYAAPEQWRDERATSATDVYAFGVTAYELLSGRRPFNGPDYREQHLHERPDELPDTIDSALRSLIMECLIKAPQARPTPKRLEARINARLAAEIPRKGASSLIEAHNREVQRLSEQARKKSEEETESRRRAELMDAARQTFQSIERELVSIIHESAPSATHDWPVKLGGAHLDLSGPKSVASQTGIPFDVIAHTTITIDQSRVPGGSYIGRSHSLWYCDAQQEGVYVWHETAFMEHPLMPSHRGFNASKLYVPFSLSPTDGEARQALGSGVGTHQPAWPFTPLIDANLDDFLDRWTNWLADASGGRLGRPGTMPERDITGSWRR